LLLDGRPGYGRRPLASASLTPAPPPPVPARLDGGLAWHAVAATRAAAIAAAHWAGRGDARAADAAATGAMRAVLATGPGRGTVVTGEGAKDDAPMLADGECLGLPGGARYDIAVDPLECTDLCARGLPGALSTMAIAPRGSLWAPGAAYYMQKLVLGRAARGAAALDDPPEAVVAQVARALCKRAGDVRVVVLDKPRHRELFDRLRRAGAREDTHVASRLGEPDRRGQTDDARADDEDGRTDFTPRLDERLPVFRASWGAADPAP